MPTKAYRAANHDRVLATARAWRVANPERIRAYGRIWQALNREKIRVAARARYAANPEKTCAYNRNQRRAYSEKLHAYNKAWKAANPAILQAQRAKRKAHKLAAAGRGVTATQWLEVIDAALGVCAYCGGRCTLTLDHIEPLGRGGAHDIENIAAVCGRCNSSKRNTPLLIWLARRWA